jgi:tetratricopeptide (TPR) repeat protein
MDRPTLERALASAVHQTLRPAQIVVVAACGAGHRLLPDRYDGVPLRLVLPAQPLDRAAAANAALDAAHCEWLNFLDDDDELLPDHLAHLAAAVHRRADVRLAHARAIVVREDGDSAGEFGRAHHRIELLEHSQFPLMAALFHRSLVEAGARFDESLPIHEDLDFWIQCAHLTRFAFVDRITSRWHAFIGSSGGGGGANLDLARVEAVQRKLSQKWAGTRDAWSGETDGLVFLAHKALQAGRSKDALALLERACASAPDDINVLNLGGVANYREGNLERARELLVRALQRAPGHPGIAENLRLVDVRATQRNRDRGQSCNYSRMIREPEPRSGSEL